MFFWKKTKRLKDIWEDYERRIKLLQDSNEMMRTAISNGSMEQTVISQKLRSLGYEVKRHYASLGCGQRHLLKVEVVKIAPPIDSITVEVEGYVKISEELKKAATAIREMHDAFDNKDTSLRERCAEMIFSSPCASAGVRISDVEELYNWITNTKEDKNSAA